MRILIVEDEPLVAQRLRREAATFFGARVRRVVHCDTLEASVALLGEEQFDLVLLDLNLHGEDGFNLLAAAGRTPFNTIVVSAHAERALTAFDVGVLDFVAKPFSQARLAQAFQRHLDSATGMRSRKLLVRRLGDIELVDIDAISHARADGHYAELTLADGSTRFHDQPLDKLVAVLGEGFLRVHRSYAVNLAHVLRLTVGAGGRYGLDTRFATAIPVSRTRYHELRIALGAPA
jgi:two-component system, LytTR family, response regulator LytT